MSLPLCLGNNAPASASCDVAQALSSAQTRLQLAQEAAGIGVWEYDPGTGQLHWSPEQFVMHGMAPGQTPPDFATWLALVEPEDREAVMLAERSLVSGATATARGEFRIRRKSDGARRWLLALTRLVTRPGGMPTLVGVNFDITELRQAEDRLRNTGALLRMVQEAVGIGLWEFDLQARMAVWSPEQFALYGMDAQSPPPRYEEWLELVHKDDRAMMHAAQKDLLTNRTDTLQREFRVKRASDGALRWLACLGRLVPDPESGLPRMAGVTFDVTDLRRTEGELRHTTALLHAIGACTPDPIFAKDLAGRYIYANPAVLAVFGSQAADVIGQTDSSLLDDKRAAAAFEAADRRVLETHEPVVVETEIALPGGVVRSFRSAKAPLCKENGETIGVAGAAVDISQLKAAEAALRDSEDMFRATFEQAAVGMAFVAVDGTMLRVNQRLCDLLGYSREEVLRLKPRDVTHPDDMADSVSLYEKFLASGGKPYRTDKRYIRKDGAALWVTLTVSMLYDKAGRPRHCLAVAEDLTQRKLAELAVQESEALARRLFDGAPLPNYIVDPATSTIVDSNEAATAMLGYTRDELRGMKLDEIDMTPEGVERIPAHLMQTDEPVQFETRHRTRDGAVRDVVIAVVPVRTPERRLAHGTVVDISDRKRAEADLKNQAERDGLTGLASRNWFLAVLESALCGKGPAARRTGALILVDIDYFKQVNDTLGHDAGDALLIEIGRRLRAKCRAEDIPARLGGDEFALLIPGVRDERAMAARMSDILAAMMQPIEVGGRLLHVTVSMGATRFPRDAAGPKDLLKHADLALYEAKRSGRSCWRFFRPQQAESLERHVRMADALRHAIEARDIQIALQPKWRLEGGHAGFEALARWHDGTRWVPPGEFVPIAEATGLARPLGRLVLDTALARLKSLRRHWREAGHVAVNVSGADLLDADFIAHTRGCLRRYRLTPADLELEVTETVLLGRTADQVDSVLRELRDLGISIALDDFGTGFASLAHISRLAVDRLKIDRSFVSGIGEGPRAGLIARTIISLARELGMESVAEGVETEEQLAFLAAEGCDAVQGYLIARPLLGEAEVVAYLRQGRAGWGGTPPPDPPSPI